MLLQVPCCVVPGQVAADATAASTTKDEPASAELTNSETTNAEPANAEPTNAEPTNAELTNAEPTNAELTKAEPTSRSCTYTEPSAKASSDHAEKADGFHEIEDGAYCLDATTVHEERQKAKEKREKAKHLEQAPDIVEAICYDMARAVSARENEADSLDEELNMCSTVAAFLSPDDYELPWQLRWELFLDQGGLIIISQLLSPHLDGQLPDARVRSTAMQFAQAALQEALQEGGDSVIGKLEQVVESGVGKKAMMYCVLPEESPDRRDTAKVSSWIMDIEAKRHHHHIQSHAPLHCMFQLLLFATDAPSPGCSGDCGEHLLHGRS